MKLEMTQREATSSDGKIVSSAGFGQRIRSSVLGKLVSLAQADMQKKKKVHILSGQLN